MTRFRRNKSKYRKEIDKEKLSIHESNELIVYPEYRSFFGQISEIHSDNLNIYEYNGNICVNGFYVSGYVAYGQVCEQCGHTIIYDIDHGTDFCPNCNVWLFEGCSDPGCELCTTRPVRPLPDFGINDDTFPVRSRGGWNRYPWTKLDI